MNKKTYIVYFWRKESDKRDDILDSDRVVAYSESHAISIVRYNEPITKNNMIVDRIVEVKQRFGY